MECLEECEIVRAERSMQTVSDQSDTLHPAKTLDIGIWCEHGHGEKARSDRIGKQESYCDTTLNTMSSIKSASTSFDRPHNTAYEVIDPKSLVKMRQNWKYHHGVCLRAV